MKRRRRSLNANLPHTLIEAVKDGRAVVVFGSGASMECMDASGRSPPNADQLRDLLAKKYLDTENEKRDLATIAEMCIAGGSGQTLVFEEITRLLSGYTPSPAHIKVADFRWRGLATTNYDTFIEEGYAKNSMRKQVCLPFVKDVEPYDDRLRNEVRPVPLLKLHGCLNHRLDPDIPLVLSHEHYHRLRLNREHLLQRLKQWAQASTLIFIGYRLADSHLRSLVYEIDPDRRPQWYIVSPGADEHDRRFWASKSIEVITGTFSEFINTLDENVPELFRALAPPYEAIELPYRRHFRTHDAGSDLLRNSLHADLEYVHAALALDEVEPKKFYEGYDQGWCGIIRNYDFPRQAGDRLLYAALDENDQREQRFLLLQGSAGSGKTIALRRAAYDAATALDQIVFWLRETGRVRADVFEEFFNLTGKKVVLFVDHIALYADEINDLLKKLSERKIPITIIASERESDWGTYCEELEKTFPPELHFLRQLSEREAEDLVVLLDRHNCLGLLESKSKSERIASFLNKDRADRQLLVALHELTQGKPFEQIILEEYIRVIPDAARQLYLDIATMHQFGVIARAGAISRISGIRFADFEEQFFSPLKDIVRIVSDRYTGDRGYAARHPRVSRIVFGVACPTDIDKSAQLSRIVKGLDGGFSADMRIIESVCKGRAMASEFSRIDTARDIFDAVLTTLPNSAFLFQQAAILEYRHKDGSLDRAQKLAEKARELDSNNHIYIHTLAEVARRKASKSTSKIKNEQLRAQSRSYLNEIWLKNSHKDLTFCNLLVDEILELLQPISNDPKEHEIIEFDDKVAETIERLKRAQHDFPDEAEFASVEGRLWRMLGQSDLASKAFEKAIGARPRNSGAFVHLSNIQRAAGNTLGAVETLGRALKKFPNDKNIHLQMAFNKIEIVGNSNSEIEYHFRSSFGVGDQNFDARFHYAKYLFWSGQMAESKSLFEEIDRKSPDNFRKSVPSSDDVITDRLGRYSGTIETVKDRYFFIRFGGYPASIFAHMSALLDLNFEELEVGTPVEFRVRFNRRGPVAFWVRPRV